MLAGDGFSSLNVDFTHQRAGHVTHVVYSGERRNAIFNPAKNAVSYITCQAADNTVVLEFNSEAEAQAAVAQLSVDAVLYLSPKWGCKGAFRVVLAARYQGMNQMTSAHFVEVHTATGSIKSMFRKCVFRFALPQ